MKIAIASDHGGFKLKEVIKSYETQLGHSVIDCGTYNEASCDYPIYAYKASKLVASKEAECGILICGTGVGVSIVANKVKGIRCALVHDVFTAEATRCHNNTNMLAMGQRVIGEGLALKIVETWLKTEYEGGRHDKRIAQMMDIESGDLDV